MKYIHDFSKPLSEMSKEEFEEKVKYKEHPHKKEVLDYMTSDINSVGYTTAPAYDRITGQEVYDGDNCHHDDNFYWYVTDIYSLERYNIMPSDEFVEYVLSRKVVK